MYSYIYLKCFFSVDGNLFWNILIVDFYFKIWIVVVIKYVYTTESYVTACSFLYSPTVPFHVCLPCNAYTYLLSLAVFQAQQEYFQVT